MWDLASGKPDLLLPEAGKEELWQAEGETPRSTDLTFFLPLDLLPCTHQHTWSLALGKHRGLSGTLLGWELMLLWRGASVGPAHCWLEFVAEVVWTLGNPGGAVHPPAAGLGPFSTP